MSRVRTLSTLLLLSMLLAAAVGPAAAGGPGTSQGSGGGHGVQARQEMPLDTPASNLRVALSQILSEHAFLTVGMMRAAAQNAPDEKAAAAALKANTAELRKLIATIYGDDAAGTFAQLWQQHLDEFEAYARASGKNDTQAADAALDGLADYRSKLAAFFAEQSPDLAPESLTEMLQFNIDQVTAYTSRDYVRAFATERESYSHMFQTGDILASAIARQFPEKFRGNAVAWSPAASLRLTLDRVLGEHLILSAEAMRAGAAAGPELEAASGALRANSADLAAAIKSIYGEDAAKAFAELWDRHVSAYLQYITAVESGDQSAASRARRVLQGYGGSFGTFMASANPQLQAKAVAGLIGHHTQALLAQVDAYRARDYARAYGRIREAYAHMFTVGDALANALVSQFPDRFQLPPPNTSTLPEAATQRNAATGPAVIALVFALALVLVIRVEPMARVPRRLSVRAATIRRRS